MSLFERFRKPHVQAEPPVSSEQPAPNLRVVHFEDDRVHRNLFKTMVEEDLQGKVLATSGEVIFAFEVVDKIISGQLNPNAVIVDRNLTGSRAGLDSRRARILTESGVRDASRIGTGHFIVYELRRARSQFQLPFRIIGLSATDMTNCDEQFWPDISFTKPINGEKKLRFLDELRLAANL